VGKAETISTPSRSQRIIEEDGQKLAKSEESQGRPDKVKNRGILHALHCILLPALSRRALVFLRSRRIEIIREKEKKSATRTVMCERREKLNPNTASS